MIRSRKGEAEKTEKEKNEDIIARPLTNVHNLADGRFMLAKVEILNMIYIPIEEQLRDDPPSGCVCGCLARLGGR